MSFQIPGGRASLGVTGHAEAATPVGIDVLTSGKITNGNVLMVHEALKGLDRAAFNDVLKKLPTERFVTFFQTLFQNTKVDYLGGKCSYKVNEFVKKFDAEGTTKTKTDFLKRLQDLSNQQQADGSMGKDPPATSTSGYLSYLLRDPNDLPVKPPF